jgi:hypothetical protein
MPPIRASEIGEYVFCHRAWWLRRARGLKSSNMTQMAEGTAAHARHGQHVGLAAGLRALALILLGIAILWLLWNFR